MKEKLLNIAIPEDLHLFFKMYAVKSGVTMKDLMIGFIESLKNKEVLEEKESGQKNK